MPVAETDETLLAQWQSQHDSTAFDALFQRHYERVYRVVYNLVGSREEAEDLAQETFLALYHTPPSLKDGEGGLAAWLCRVALNRGYNTLRSNRRTQQRMERMGEPLSGMEASDPYSMAVRAEERAYVQAILAQLPERQSKLLLLRYAGLSYAEIAATLGIAPGSVGTLLARAERSFLAKSSQPVVH